ncbi:AAA family ATPase [Cupriavidus gilardii]|nr:AAA family ATPase [Cupriavidus gilardii]
MAKFKKLNILYGRNYSGKTTLSRIVRALETGAISQRFAEPGFQVTFTTNGQISHEDIPVQAHSIRVYNKDFVDEHLAFLRDEHGHISPFAVLGHENKEIEIEIEALEKELGSIETQLGLRYEFQIKKAAHGEKENLATKAADALEKLLFDKANKRPTGIKHNPLYRDATYDVRKLKADIKTVRDGGYIPLTEAERNAKVALLSETALPDTRRLPKFSPSLAALTASVNELIGKKIQPSAPLQELLNDAVLQNWVKAGIGLHRDTRSTCAFCGTPLPATLWKTLGDHFDQASANLERQITLALSEVSKERDRIDAVLFIDRKIFYAAYQTTFEERARALEDALNLYRASLLTLESELTSRRDNIFADRSACEIIDPSQEIHAQIAAINELIDQNNQATVSLSERQSTARNDLRLSEVAQFVADIGLAEEEHRIRRLMADARMAKEERDVVEAEGKKRNERIKRLKTQLRDERRGAEQVNRYLAHSLGHGGLRLSASEEPSTATYRFQIMRGEQTAYNLSEGECSLVAFCYFLAKLDDVDTQGKKLIIYIDDPISSLDSNHIFFVFSLIENYLAKPVEDEQGNVIKDVNNKPAYRYEQLFISTHNLEFLKYLKRLSKPSKENESFLITRKDTSSVIGLMPHYLRHYVTELNYLFGEIFCCANDANATKHFHSFYNFGNNLRKFLEAFLFFKYPSARSDRSDHDERIKLFFSDGTNSEAYVQRLINEFSHLGEFIDRSTQPIDCTEIASLAKFVLKKIRDNDKEQFDHFLLSIEKTDPFLRRD